MTEARIAALVDNHQGVYASIHRQVWEGEPEDIRVRMLARLLSAYGGQAKLAQLSQVEALVEALASGRPMAQTLGGCIVSQGRTTLRLYREPQHHTLTELMMRPGDEVVWDWRFRVRYDAEEGDETPQQVLRDTARAVTVRPLGLAAYATLRGSLQPRERPPARAAAGLPSVWSGERLLAVPNLAGLKRGDERFSAVFLGFKRVQP